VHSWTGRIYIGGDGVQTEPPSEPIPDTLDWDLWLNTAATRPYNAACSGSGARTWISAPAGRSAIGWCTTSVR